MHWSRRAVLAAPALWARGRKLSLSTFAVPVSPPPGSPLCYSLVVPAAELETPLWAKGVVLYPEGQKPIVLCAVDWLGIGGESHLAWREELAKACGSTPDRVAVQTVHQHDAPGADAGAHRILAARGMGDLLSPAAFCRTAITRVAARIREAKQEAVREIGFGQAKVDRVASNRRILSPDGQRFVFQRFTACRNSEYCDAPEGVIDPMLKTVSFHGESGPLASLHYYATHPMSYYGKGVINADFVGIARESLPGFHVYFTGAAGNVGAGKYNDGAPARREELAARLKQAMLASLAAEQRSKDLAIRWATLPVLLPHRAGADFAPAASEAVLASPSATAREKASASRYLAWAEACRRKTPILLSGLASAGGSILHMPAELFVEYQLAAQKEKPNLPVAMAAYGDYGPMYIGTAKSYQEGGYETSAVSRVAPESEDLLLSSVQRLMRLMS